MILTTSIIFDICVYQKGDRKMKTKPFNLEECLAGKPIVTRGGTIAVLMRYNEHDKVYPLHINVGNLTFSYTGFGTFYHYRKDKLDLLMVDESEEINGVTSEQLIQTFIENANQHEAGVKLDQDKIPVRRGLLEQFPNACLAVAEVSAFGAKKYTWGGWLTVEDGINRYGDAGMRHALQQGIDEESGLLHAAHEAWNALARLELILRSK